MILACFACAPLSTPDLASPPASLTAVTLSLVQVDVSSAPASRAFIKVRDQDNNPLTDFKRGNFAVVVGGAPRPVVEVGKVTDPIKAVLIIDRSGSMGGDTADVNSACSAFIDLFGTDDEAAVIEFSTTVKTSQDFTKDKTAIKNVINDGDDENGATSLYDALYKGADLMGGTAGRKVLIALTDGADNTSTRTLEQAITRINENGLSAAVISLGTDVEVSQLQSIADQTSGQLIQLNTVTYTQLVTTYTNILAGFSDLYFVRYLERARDSIDVYLNYGSFTGKASKTF